MTLSMERVTQEDGAMAEGVTATVDGITDGQVDGATVEEVTDGSVEGFPDGSVCHGLCICYIITVSLSLTSHAFDIPTAALFYSYEIIYFVSIAVSYSISYCTVHKLTGTTLRPLHLQMAVLYSDCYHISSINQYHYYHH